MSETNEKKTGKINARLTQKLRDRLDKIFMLYGVADARMAEDALTALADYVEARGGYFRPMCMVFYEQPVSHAAEDAAPYDAPQADDKKIRAALAEELRKKAQKPSGHTAR